MSDFDVKDAEKTIEESSETETVEKTETTTVETPKPAEDGDSAEEGKP